jgi:16S rRNA (uracil1498-N3)-methyltransferase
LHTVKITIGDRTAITGRIVRSEKNVNELGIEITVAFGLMTIGKTEEVIDQLTQLGVNRLQPLQTEKSVIRLDRRKLNLKLDRWRRLALASMKQSLRCRLPEISKPCTVEQMAAQVNDFDVALFGALQGQRIAAASETPVPGRMLLITGPEGGFTDNEQQQLAQAGARAVTLGERRLRAELAPVVLTTMALCGSV